MSVYLFFKFWHLREADRDKMKKPEAGKTEPAWATTSASFALVLLGFNLGIVFI